MSQFLVMINNKLWYFNSQVSYYQITKNKSY